MPNCLFDLYVFVSTPLLATELNMYMTMLSSYGGGNVGGAKVGECGWSQQHVSNEDTDRKRVFYSKAGKKFYVHVNTRQSFT